MASIVLTAAGSALGNMLLPGIGGAVLGGLGGMLGGTIDNAIFGRNVTVKGPRLDQLRIQDSSYGNGIPLLYGRNRVAGNVIWAGDLIETLTEESSSSGGGKGGGGSASVQRASYSVDCAIAIGQGMFESIGSIWADGKPVYSNGVWKSGLVQDAEIYLGTTTQSPSPLMEAALGTGLVPAYRGVAYVVIHRLQLADFGNRLPNFTFEVMPAASAAPEWLGEQLPAGGVGSYLLGRPDSFANPSALPPLTIKRRGSRSVQVVVGAIDRNSTQYRFAAVEYDISGDAPVEINRRYSDWVTRTGDVTDFCWSHNGDFRRIAFYMQHTGSGLPTALAVYDSVTRSFGPVTSDGLTTTNAQSEITWLDAQHIIVADVVSAVRGVRVYAVAWLGVVPLGFTGVWGSGSSSTRLNQPGAYYGHVAGGVVWLTGNNASAPTTLYVRTLRWGGSGLEIGGETTLATGIASFTATRNRLMGIGNDEFVLVRNNTTQLRLFSFTAGFTSAVSVTRAWTTISISLTGAMTVNYANGVIGVLHQRAAVTTYRYAEILITPTSFNMPSATVEFTGTYNGSPAYFSFFPADSLRHVILLGDGSSNFARIALVSRSQNMASLGVIAANLLERAGYSSADYDVSALSSIMVAGYALSEPMPARGALESLQIYAPFDLVESDGLLQARLHSATADTAILTSETRAAREDETPPPTTITKRAQEQDLPAEVTVDYLDPALDYQKNSQRARRMAGNALSSEQIRLPMVASSSTAKQIAERQLYRGWLEREEITAPLSRSYMMLSPGDVVTLAGRNMRLTEITHTGGLLQLKGVPVSSYMASTAAGDSGLDGAGAESSMVATLFYLMDLPALRSDDDAPGLYVAATGTENWKGAVLYRSVDGVNFTQLSSFTLPATAGLAASVLDDAPSFYMDRAHSVNVGLLNGTLSSCTELELLNGANVALLGDEIIQFGNATLNSDGSYALSNIIRGRRGTESATASHVLGERFVMLKTASVNFMPLTISDRNRSYQYRAPSLNQDVSAVPSTLFTPQLRTLQPLAPTHVTGARDDVSGDLTIGWKRRARLEAEWHDYIEVPLDEDAELYDIEIMNGLTVVRSFLGNTSTSVVYSGADQTTDFGSLQTSVSVKIYQLSGRYGRGVAAATTV